MPSGYPDYFSQPMVSRPGEIKLSTIGTNVPASSTATILSLSGKGRLFRGYIGVANDPGHQIDSIKLTVDGIVMFNRTWLVMKNINQTDNSCDTFAIRQYDYESGNFTLFVNPEIPYSSSLLLECINACADTVLLFGYATYYEIG